VSVIYTHYNSLQHAVSLLSLLYLNWLLPGNSFQCHSFLSFHVHILTGRQLSHNSLPGWGPSHTNFLVFSLLSQISRNHSCCSLYSLGMDHVENTGSNSSYIVACMSVVVITEQQLLNSYFSHSSWLATGLHATICKSVFPWIKIYTAIKALLIICSKGP
jgi:hypothetical protein